MHLGFWSKERKDIECDLVGKYTFPRFLCDKLYFNFDFGHFQHLIREFQWFEMTPESLYNSIFRRTLILQIINKIDTKTSYIRKKFAYEYRYIMHENIK